MSAIVAQSSDSDSDYEELEPSLRNLVEQTSLKWIFVGGKGGVGKTTSSSSIGVLLSKTRRKVLIISTDPAHNVSDAFSQKFSNEPIQVKGFDNLYAMEIETKNPGEGLITTANDGSGIPEDEGATASIQSMLKELTSAVPGIDECMSFAELMKQVQTMDYDCIVFDTAPTGHTLRLVGIYSEGAAREWSTVVDISITPPSFKPISLFLSRYSVSKTPKQVFFNPINIFDTFTTLFYYYQFLLFSFNVKFYFYSCPCLR